MTREEWQMQMLILTHEESDAEHYNAALHTLEAWDIAQRMKTEQQAKEIARLRDKLERISRHVPIMGSTGAYRQGQLDVLESVKRIAEEHP